MAGYTIQQFNIDYPDDSSCLHSIFLSRYGDLKSCPKCSKKSKFYRIKDRRSYECAFCCYQLYPTAGTIFHKSTTPLKNWFYAMFLMSNSKNGISAAELQRQLGVSYKTAWRINQQIRTLFKSHKEEMSQLEGIVEVDETYIGRKNESRKWERTSVANKAVVMGMIERDGRVVGLHIPAPGVRILVPAIQKHISINAHIMSDELTSYKNLYKLGYKHDYVNHRHTYVNGEVYTNTIEGFWSQLKRSIHGTYHTVSHKHLQGYVDEFCYRYNHRKSNASLFSSMVLKASQV